MDPCIYRDPHAAEIPSPWRPTGTPQPDTAFCVGAYMDRKFYLAQGLLCRPRTRFTPVTGDRYTLRQVSTVVRCARALLRAIRYRSERKPRNFYQKESCRTSRGLALVWCGNSPPERNHAVLPPALAVLSPSCALPDRPCQLHRRIPYGACCAACWPVLFAFMDPAPRRRRERIVALQRSARAI